MKRGGLLQNTASKRGFKREGALNRAFTVHYSRIPKTRAPTSSNLLVTQKRFPPLFTLNLITIN